MQRNISDWERAASIVAATFLGALAASNREARGPAGGAAGGLLLRGVMGYCPVSAAFGRNSRRRDTKQALGGSNGVHVRQSITIARPVEEVYNFWRDLANLPRFMQHVEHIEVRDRTRSRWTVRGPAGTSVTWDAHIINEIPYELLAWSSVGDADVISAGSVHFKSLPNGSTRILIHLQYQPPAGKFGAWVAALLGEEPSQQIAEDLQRLKAHLEWSGSEAHDGRPAAAFPAYPSNEGNVKPYQSWQEAETV